MTQAEKWLADEAKKYGWAKATQMQGRQTMQGLVAINVDGPFAAMAEVSCNCTACMLWGLSYKQSKPLTIVAFQPAKALYYWHASQQRWCNETRREINQFRQKHIVRC